MKKAILFPCIICLFISCKKNNAVPDPSLLEHYPQTWILMVDEAPDKYVYLRTNGANMFRKSVDKSYSLTQLAIDEDCEFEINQSRSETETGSKVCFTIRLDKDKTKWVFAGLSPNKQEKHLGTSNFSGNGDPGDNYKFFIHDMPKENGVRTVALESVYYPGYYISSSPPGFNYAQNQVTLQQATSPDKATHWQCR